MNIQGVSFADMSPVSGDKSTADREVRALTNKKAELEKQITKIKEDKNIPDKEAKEKIKTLRSEIKNIDNEIQSIKNEKTGSTDKSEDVKNVENDKNSTTKKYDTYEKSDEKNLRSDENIYSIETEDGKRKIKFNQNY